MTEQATAVALLDAAEVQFAVDGIDQASLRSIMRAAGANPAAVHYHYGSREQLAAAVLERILEPIQARRLELLGVATTAGRAECVDLVDALVRPDYEAVLAAGARDPRSTRIVGVLYSRPPEFVTTLVEASFAPVAAAFMPHLAAAVPDVDPATLAWRVRWNLFAMLGAVLGSDEARSITARTVDEEIAKAVHAAVGALTAADPEGGSR